MRRCAGISLLLALASLLAAGPAGAAPTVADTFDLSGQPGRITEGPDGNVWVLLSGSSDNNEIARVEPDGTVTEFDSNDLSNAVGITTGPDGKLWVTKSQAVGSFDPADPTNIDLTPITQVSGQDIVAGPDGDLWTPGDATVVQIPPDDPANPLFHDVSGLSGRGIAAGGDGRIWVVDFAGQQLVRMKTDGTFTTIAIGGQPQQVAAGPGEQMAYTNPNAADTVVGLLTPPADPENVAMPNTDPFGITFAIDGAYWTARFAANDLARITPDGKLTPLGGFPASSGPRYLTPGENGTLWVSLETSHQVGEVTGIEAPKPPKAPKVKITKAPKSKVKTKGKKKAKVKFAFKSKTKGVKFRCSLEKRNKRPHFGGCSSPEIYRLKPGKYEFEVKAKAGGVTGKPATADFKVVKG
jgi:virginiamycin B lyase